MRKVTTNMTFGQVLFVLLILVSSSLMFFYLGAKFGGDIMSLAKTDSPVEDEPFLPDDRLAAEAEAILLSTGDDFLFHDALQSKTPPSLYVAGSAGAPPASSKSVAGNTSVPAAENKSALAKPKPPVNRDTARTVIMPGEKTTAGVKADPALKSAVKAELPATVKLPEKTSVIVQEKGNPLPLYAEPVRLASPEVASYRLQIGSYARKNRAKEARAEWEKRGYAAEIVETTMPGKGKWYRIKLGSFVGMDEVRNAQQRIMQSYQQTAMIVPE